MKLQDSDADAEDNERKKKFRLSLKKRFNKQNADLPDRQQNATAFKQELEKAYQEELSMIEYVATRVRHHRAKMQDDEE